MATLTCHICGATGTKGGKAFERQGQLNLHTYHCKMKEASKVEAQKFYGKSEPPKKNENIEECTHEWRFLNRKSIVENKAYLGGYKEVCSQCQELK